MARRTPALHVLVTMLAVVSVSCSTTEAGTAVVATNVGGTATSSTTASSTTAPSTRPPSTTVSSTTAPSTTVSSTTAPSTTVSSTMAPSTTTPSTTAPSTTRSTAAVPTTVVSTTAGAPSFALCPKTNASDARSIVSCLRTSLSTFWSGELNEVIDQPVVVEPTTAQVPQQCRGAITVTSAFTCQVNDTVYLNTSLVEAAEKDFTAGELPYVFATVMGHEIGHVVQAAVKQPGYTDTGSSPAISQRIEQQADCLDGVWAHSLIAAHQLDRATFVRVTNTFITSISSNPEIAGHGTPPERAAALAKGLKNGRPQDCGLATFS